MMRRIWEWINLNSENISVNFSFRAETRIRSFILKPGLEKPLLWPFWSGTHCDKKRKLPFLQTPSIWSNNRLNTLKHKRQESMNCLISMKRGLFVWFMGRSTQMFGIGSDGEFCLRNLTYLWWPVRYFWTSWEKEWSN
jgi:hypothetical protein